MTMTSEAVWRELGASLRDRMVSPEDAAAARGRVRELMAGMPRTYAPDPTPAPASRKRCRACGWRGRHAPGCRRAPVVGADAVSVQETSANRKLGPVDMLKSAGARLSPRGAWPFVSSTYVAIGPTCPDSCAFKGSGCYVEEGLTGWHMERMNAAAVGRSAYDVVQAEARAIAAMFGGGRIPQDGAKGGRDLRLHVGGDAGDADGAAALAWAADGWHRRGGGAVWTFTHWWRAIPRSAWGPVSVLASCDTESEVAEAAALGYAPALVVPRFNGRKAFPVRGWAGKLIPCPAESTGGATTCVECRLCLSADSLLARSRGIAFEVHGTGADQAAAQLIPASSLRR